MELLLTVDPGKTTGYGLIQHDESGLVEVSFDQREHFEFLDFFEAVIDMWGAGLTVVCESFMVTARSVQQRGERLWSVEQIGVLRNETRKAGVDYIEQSPSDAKSFATDAKLRKLGWYVKGKEHSRDAARHALLYCCRKGLIDPATLLS